MRKTDAKIFSEIPNELKTIEVDVEKKIFKVNGVPFGRKCTGFRISCDAAKFQIYMEVDTSVILANYNMRGDKTADYSYEKEVAGNGS